MCLLIAVVAKSSGEFDIQDSNIPLLHSDSECKNAPAQTTHPHPSSSSQPSASVSALQWAGIKPFLTAHDHLKGTNQGKYAPKVSRPVEGVFKGNVRGMTLQFG